MTDKEIINALRCCVKVDCDSCPYSLEDCEQNLANDTINLIIHQKKQIHWLEIELKSMRGAANSYKAEVERMKKGYFWVEESVIKSAKAEAVKEFAERAKTEILCSGYFTHEYYKCKIDNLVKEMVGED